MTILDTFDEAAQRYGWEKDQGSEQSANKALKEYLQAKRDLEDMLHTVWVSVGNKKMRLRHGGNVLVNGKYICGADDLYDLGFTVQEVKDNTVRLHIGDLTIECGSESVTEIPLSKLRYHKSNSYELDVLVQNIQQYGLKQPIIVRRDAGSIEYYRVIDGVARVQALKKLGYKTAPCKIKVF